VRLCTTLHRVTQSLLLSAQSAGEQLFGVCNLLRCSSFPKPLLAVGIEHNRKSVICFQAFEKSMVIVEALEEMGWPGLWYSSCFPLAHVAVYWRRLNTPF